MPKYNITYNAKLNEDVCFSVEAASQEAALHVAESIAWDILTTSSFANENMTIHCQSIQLERPTYTALTNVASLDTQPTSGYTPLASIYSRNRNPALANQQSGSAQKTSIYTPFI